MTGLVGIRTGTADDIARLQAIELDAARAYATSPGHAFCVDLPARGEAEHVRVLATGTALVAERDGVAVGFVLLMPLDAGTHVLEAAVLLADQRLGIGRALLDAAIGWAKTAGRPELTLTTFRDVPWNAPVYSGIGFEEVSSVADRPGLRSILDEERTAGLARVPRIAMRRRPSGDRRADLAAG